MKKELPTTNYGKLPEKEFNLSERIVLTNFEMIGNYIGVEDVAQKIKEAKKDIFDKTDKLISKGIKNKDDYEKGHQEGWNDCLGEIDDIVNDVFTKHFGTLAEDGK